MITADDLDWFDAYPRPVAHTPEQLRKATSRIKKFGFFPPSDSWDSYSQSSIGTFLAADNSMNYGNIHGLSALVWDMAIVENDWFDALIEDTKRRYGFKSTVDALTGDDLRKAAVPAPRARVTGPKPDDLVSIPFGFYSLRHGAYTAYDLNMTTSQRIEAVTRLLDSLAGVMTPVSQLPTPGSDLSILPYGLPEQFDVDWTCIYGVKHSSRSARRAFGNSINDCYTEHVISAIGRRAGGETKWRESHGWVKPDPNRYWTNPADR